MNTKTSQKPKSFAFISWIHFHGRSEGIARELGIEEWTQSGGDGPAWRRYLQLWRDTGKYLRMTQPDSVIVMQPPIVALWAVRWHLRGKKARIAGDLHTGVFDDPKWTWATRLTLKMLRAPNLAIVTNDALAHQVHDAGAEAVVMHDLIEPYTERSGEEFDDSQLDVLRGKQYVLVPVAYSYDEPLDALRDAAASTPGLTWVFTGKAPQEFRDAAPANVLFSGFASRDDYMRMLSAASVIIAATTSENTMQRAGYEALCMARPLVTTRTRVLVDYFADAVISADPDAESIAGAVNRTLDEFNVRVAGMRALRAVKLDEQAAAIRKLRDWLDG